MKERAFDKICGDCTGVDLGTITEEDIRKQAEVWATQGEPCTEDEIEDAIAYLNESQRSDSLPK